MTTDTRYSPFWALLIFFAAVTAMDLDQTLKIHREKLSQMQQYAQALKVQRQLETQTKWIGSMREDLLRLAPGHPEASQIVAELHLQKAPAPAAAGTP